MKDYIIKFVKDNNLMLHETVLKYNIAEEDVCKIVEEMDALMFGPEEPIYQGMKQRIILIPTKKEP